MPDTKPPTARTIDLRIDDKASLDEVWQALTTGEGLANWFPPQASATPGPGGSLTLTWDAGEDWVAPIVVWEPNVRLGITSDAPSKDGGTVRLAIRVLTLERSVASLGERLAARSTAAASSRSS